MTIVTDARPRVTLGIDTHRDTNVAALLDERGAELDQSGAIDDQLADQVQQRIQAGNVDADRGRSAARGGVEMNSFFAPARRWYDLCASKVPRRRLLDVPWRSVLAHMLPPSAPTSRRLKT